MGQIINLDTWSGELPAPLTETGSGGFLSRGYLVERPARDHVDGDETVRYVLTNRKRGVTIDGETTAPDSRHRTVAVVTDRRLLVLVGGAESDSRFVTDLSRMTDVEATVGRRAGRLTVERTDGTTWHVHTDTDGLEAVAAYLSTAADAWRAVEGELDSVRGTLAETRELRREGAYEAAIETLRGCKDRLESAWAIADEFTAAHPGDALQARPSAVESECRAAAAAIRIDRARDVTDIARDHCQAGDYDAAQTALERAGDEYDAALRVAEGELDGTERIAAERDRVAELVTRLRESPLRQAITADKAGVEADDIDAAADHWETALSQYRVALDADGSDPERIRERACRIAEQLTAIQRSEATDAMQAGDWYADAGQHEAALEAFERADEIFGRALSTAESWYPDAVPHLEAERTAVTQRLERTRATLDGEEVDDRLGTAQEPDLSGGEVGDPATLGAPGDVEGTIEPPSGIPSRAGDELLPDPTTVRLQDLDHRDVTDIVAAALDETDWTTRPAAARTPFDLFARRDGELTGVVVADDPVIPALVEHCETVCGAAGTDSVMLVATDECAEPAARLADERGVRLLRSESLGAILDTTDVRLPASR